MERRIKRKDKNFRSASQAQKDTFDKVGGTGRSARIRAGINGYHIDKVKKAKENQ
jgi:hypothetical protein